MTRLKQRIKKLIEANGPLSIADYMALCLFDPAAGYYTTREPFGTAGDFTTAPEISQIFGELIAVWAYSAWTAAGKPLPVTIAEIGPGRGTLMKDMLRTLSRLDAGFVNNARFAMIEASPRLTAVQRETLRDALVTPEWHASPGTLPAAPLILVGNELFDAIPVRQFVKTAAGWRERAVGLDEAGELCFIAGAGSLDAALLPPDAASAAPGAIVEIAPAREALMDQIANRIAREGGAGLFIDYGHARSAVGDTLQALRNHQYDDPLAHPGEADLTAHVDFAALAARVHAAGLEAHLMTQGEFLQAMGLAERAQRLASGQSEAIRTRLASEVERLAHPDAMGNLFKALAICLPGAPLAPFVRAD